MGKKDFTKNISSRGINANPYLNYNIKKEEPMLEEIVVETNTEIDGIENNIVDESRGNQNDDISKNEKNIVDNEIKLRAGRPLGAKKRAEEVERINLTLDKQSFNRLRMKVLSTPQLTLTDLVREAIGDYCKKHKL